jgi:hypothetical protein
MNIIHYSREKKVVKKTKEYPSSNKEKDMIIKKDEGLVPHIVEGYACEKNCEGSSTKKVIEHSTSCNCVHCTTKIDRSGNWKKFAEVMQEYIGDKTIEKYGSGGIDLMEMTPPIVAVWSCMKYSLRILNGKGKENDLRKIAHYAEIASTLLEQQKKTVKEISLKMLEAL